MRHKPFIFVPCLFDHVVPDVAGGGGDEYVVVLFQDAKVRDHVKAALDEQLEEYERKHPKAEAALVRQGWLQKCQSNGLVWQGRWFVRRQRPFRRLRDERSVCWGPN